MTRALVIACLVAALALLLAEQAGAWPGERPTTNARVLELVDVTLDYHHRAGFPGCPDGVKALEADDLGVTEDGDRAGGRGGACGILLERATIRFLGAPGDDVALCMLVAHEVGHALSRAHDDTLVMRAHPPLDQDAGPWACRKWARGQERGRARARAARRHPHHEENRRWKTGRIPSR
jgi:hypothetical protein